MCKFLFGVLDFLCFVVFHFCALIGLIVIGAFAEAYYSGNLAYEKIRKEDGTYIHSLRNTKHEQAEAYPCPSCTCEQHGCEAETAENK